MSVSSCDVPLGLIVNAKQTYYPIELSNAELLAHYETIQDYHQEISENVLQHSCRVKPDPKLIDQQPEMNPQHTRTAIVNFAFELAQKTRVTNGIFFHAVRLYDRYCSKRVVLRDQAKLVIATCLWLAAKTWGGCNHIINNVTVPTGGRFYGPNPRARIPRLSELVHYCGGSNVFDESMFTQMERHILDTLSWDVYEPMVNDYVLNVDENCLIQYELYKRQLEHNRQYANKRNSQDSNATEEDVSEEDEDLDNKIQLINIKKFLIDLAVWQYDLLKYEVFELAHGIFSIINKFTNQDLGPLLLSPIPSTNNESLVLNVFINGVIKCPAALLESYHEKFGVLQFVDQVKEYHESLQKKLQLAAAMDLSRRNNAKFYEAPSMPSPTYSQHSSYTPLRNTSNSESSVFSSVSNQQSPITPQMYSFSVQKPGSACGSSVSVNSISQKRNRDEETNYSIMGNDKENYDPTSTYTVPPRAKFAGHTYIFTGAAKEEQTSSTSNRSSLISLAIGNANSLV
ncbi:AFL174Cp [Eremothecium gossypii ATCC 10895]|uniref:G1/S-specific cyclin n=1 Tax=Eremothecium gossypii (strain ATCC 10895 / CBS 109.51 / FGSC 9923 / NRRL Y-1056) TaxID=284811 RepID=Q755J7_EREGS|nr:AFL174Cp [Eremothecium gossypii ATCC 10895]AAS53200.1 AFL174Cp [Eremothecium gossypii ATCC 10895]AEY97510.1 FAFL174Cp [Eremothecium gossypii FDAG1]